jgi:hypothetical protein
MERFLQLIINKTFKKDLEILFGNGSHVVINRCSYVTGNRGYIIDCKLFVDDVELSVITYPTGLNYLVEESWKFVGSKHGITTILSTIDIKS